MSTRPYRTPVNLEVPVETRAADGTASLVFVGAGSDFAAIRPLRQRESVGNGRLEGIITHEIRLRRREDISGGWRITAGLRRFRVLSAGLAGEREREVLCLAEEEGR